MRQGQCVYCNDILADFEDNDPIGAERCIKCRRHGNSIVAEWTPTLMQPQGHPSISSQQEDAFPISPVLPLPDFGGNGFDPGSNGSGGGDGGFGGFGGGDFGGGGAGGNF